jgi:hypothetical protein
MCIQVCFRTVHFIEKKNNYILINYHIVQSAYEMEQYALKDVNICLNFKKSLYLETSGGHSSNQFLNVLFQPVLITHLWQLKTVVFLFSVNSIGRVNEP